MTSMRIPSPKPSPKTPGGRRPLRTYRWRVVVFAVALAMVGVGAGFTVASSGASSATAVAASAPAAPSAASNPAPPVNVSGFPHGQGGGGIFTDRCRFSREAADDPILMPGMAGMSIEHHFYGNPTPTASSTASALLGKPTTCSTSADASAYWTPVLYQDGQPLQPESAL